MRHRVLSDEEILECLERSGYLLESQIVRELVDRGYFVEPNRVIFDHRTGKSRELDIVAEYFSSYNANHSGTCVKTYFIAEVVNNKYPVVLLTKRPSTPNSNWESYVKFGCTPEPNVFYKSFDFHHHRSPPEDQLFSQYCALSVKKGEAKELMASHPDDMYSSLQKVAEYTEQEFEEFADFSAESSDDIWRIFFWHPMLVLGGQLKIAENSEAGSIKISGANSAYLEFNWHQDGEPRTTIIEIVTLDALYERMGAIVAFDEQLENQLAIMHNDIKRE